MNVASTLANYGYWADRYFQYDNLLPIPHKLAESANARMDAVVVPHPSQPSFYEHVTGLQYVGSSLVLRSGTAMKIYFRLPEGAALEDFTFAIRRNDEDGYYDTAVSPQTNGDCFYLEIPDIPAAELDDEFEVAVGYNSGISSVIVHYCAMNYVDKVLDGYYPNPDDAARNLIQVLKALVLYSQATDAYFANASGE